MPTMFHRFALAALACAIAVPASAQLIQRKDLSYAMAKTIAENALAQVEKPEDGADKEEKEKADGSFNHG